MIRPRWLALYVPVSITLFLNLIVVAPPIQRYMDDYVYSDFGVAVAAVNTVIFALFTAVLVAGLQRTTGKGQKITDDPRSVVAGQSGQQTTEG